jgi:hypothetical protein
VWIAAYHLMRILKWALWAAFFAYTLYFTLNRAPHVTQFGHLTLKTELLMFGLPLAAIAVGLFELMFRDRAYPRS